MEKFASIDIETTGLKAGIHEIVQLSVNIFNQKNDGGRVRLYVIESFDTYIRPLKPHLADPKALEKNKLSLDNLKREPLPQQIRNAFFQWYEEIAMNCRLTPLGHNYIFDHGFLKIFFGDFYDSMFHYHYEDTSVYARALKRRGVLKTDSCSLINLCNYFDIKRSKLHDASDDALCTIKLYEELLNLTRLLT